MPRSASPSGPPRGALRDEAARVITRHCFSYHSAPLRKASALLLPLCTSAISSSPFFAEDALQRGESYRGATMHYILAHGRHFLTGS